MNFVLSTHTAKEEERDLTYIYGPPAFPGNYIRSPNSEQILSPVMPKTEYQSPPQTPHQPREGETRKETLQKGRDRERSRRMNETAEARELRLRKGRERERLRRLNETPEERQERLRKNCERQRRRRQSQKEREDAEKSDPLPDSPPPTLVPPQHLIKYPVPNYDPGRHFSFHNLL